MQLFYVQHGTGLTHIEAFRNVKIVISNLKSFIDKKETFGIGDIDSDIFGTPLTSDIIGEPIEKGDIWLAGTQVIPISKMLMTILERAKGDLDHQYASYLSLSDQELEKQESLTRNTPVHNIAAEQEVGMVSAAKTKATGATMIYLESLIKSTRNKTLEDLESFPLDIQKQRVKLAIKLGRQSKEISIKKGHDTEIEIVRRIGEKREEMLRKSKMHKQKHHQKERKTVEGKLESLQNAEEWEIAL